MTKQFKILALLPVVILAACTPEKGIGRKKAEEVANEIAQHQNSDGFINPLSMKVEQNMTMDIDSSFGSMEMGTTSVQVFDFTNHVITQKSTMFMGGQEEILVDQAIFSTTSYLFTVDNITKTYVKIPVSNFNTIESQISSSIATIIKFGSIDEAENNLKSSFEDGYPDSKVKISTWYDSEHAGNLSINMDIKIETNASSTKTTLEGTAIIVFDDYLPYSLVVDETAKSNGQSVREKLEQNYTYNCIGEIPDITSYTEQK